MTAAGYGARTVGFYRAQGVAAGDAPVPVLIRIVEECPDNAGAETFASEGTALAEVLWSVLPGGTIDGLIGALLARRASLLHVAFVRPEELPGTSGTPA